MDELREDSFPASVPDVHRARVLLVEDSEADALLFQRLVKRLPSWAITLEWVETVEEALRRLEEAPWDVCFCDYNLGDDTGLGLLEAIQRTDLPTPIVLCTASADPAIDRSALALGAADFLNKSQLDGQLLDRVIRYTLQRSRAQETLRRQALIDPLTGLPNRRLLMSRIEAALRRTPGDQVALLYLDLDRFKRVNDTLGHANGDRLLEEVGRRLVESVRRSDTVARLGGDEFAVLMNGARAAEAAHRIGARIIESLGQPFSVGGQEIRTGTSVGLALPTDDETAEALLQSADHAMYTAKRAGRGRLAVFHPEMRRAVVERLRLEEALGEAIERDEFTLRYQPVLHPQSRRVTSWEALVRWRHPERGLLPPRIFIPVAEASGMVVPIGWWVLRTACRQMAAWHAALPSARPALSVNLAAAQLAHEDLTEQVMAALDDAGLAPRHLILEITESAIITDRAAAEAAMIALRARGVRFYLDDFGTGYSSLSFLDRLPLDGIKIDRSFLERVSTNRKRRTILRAMIQLSRQLDLDVVSEGVETLEQLTLLQEMDCALIQGFLFARPMRAEEVPRYRFSPPSSRG